jgi:hypothetical protein
VDSQLPQTAVAPEGKVTSPGRPAAGAPSPPVARLRAGVTRTESAAALLKIGVKARILVKSRLLSMFDISLSNYLESVHEQAAEKSGGANWNQPPPHRQPGMLQVKVCRCMGQ